VLIRLLFVAAETVGTVRSLRCWAGYAAQVTLTAAVIAAMCSLVETASSLGGEAGGALRSFTTPGIVASAACAMIVTGSSARATQASLRALRSPWAAAGVTQHLARWAVAAQTICISAIAMSFGLLVARVAIATIASLEVGDHRIDLRFGGPTTIASMSIVALTVLPSTIAALRWPYRTLRKRTPLWQVIAFGAGAVLWAGTATWLVRSSVRSDSDVERDVGFSLLLLITLVVLVAVALTGCRTKLASLIRRIDAAPVHVVLGAGSGAAALSRSLSSVAPILVSVALTGGMVAVFMIGDAASAEHHGSAELSTVNVGSILLTLSPVLLLAVGSSIIAHLTAHPSRAIDVRAMRAVGLRIRSVVSAGLFEAALTAAIAALITVGVVATACVPFALAAGLDLPDLVRAALNPVLVTLSGGIASVMMLVAALTSLVRACLAGTGIGRSN